MPSSARIDELRKKFDENPRRYFAPLANEYRKAGDFDQAIFICQEYLPQQPGHMSGHIVFGQALFEAKRLPEARAVFETALGLDPENLIALRHLADISRELGETSIARTWYERVLQADPRNEEIAAIMATMPAEAPPPAPVAPVAITLETPAQPPSLARPTPPAAATPATDASSAPTVELSAAAVQEMMKARLAKAAGPKPAMPQTLDDAATIEISSIDIPEPVAASTAPEIMLDAPAFDLPSIEPTSILDAPAAEPESAFNMGDFSLPIETTSLASEPAAPASGDPSSLGLIDLGSFGSAPSAPEPSPEPSPMALDFAPTSLDTALPVTLDATPTIPFEIPVIADPTPVAEVSADSGLMDFELPSAPAASPPPSAPPAAQEMVPPLVMGAIDLDPPKPADLPFIDMDSPSSEGVEPVKVETVERVEAARKPTATPRVEAVPRPPTPTVADIPAPIAAEPPADRQSPAFVTETMAQLYLEQGHRAEAIDIYRQLVAARPDDAALRDRLATIDGTKERPAAAPEPAPTPAPSRFTSTGPTIRATLRDLFGIEAGAGTVGSATESPGEVGSIDLLFAVEAVSQTLDPLSVAFDGGYVATAGNIDTLFDGGQ